MGVSVFVGEGENGVGVREAVGVGVLLGSWVKVGVSVLVGVEVKVAVMVEVCVAVRRMSPRRLGILHAPIKIASQRKAIKPVLTRLGWMKAQCSTMLYYTGKAISFAQS
jgi:hypothetical protein